MDDNKLGINLSYKFDYGVLAVGLDYGFSRGYRCLSDKLPCHMPV